MNDLTKDTLRKEAIRHRDRIDPGDPSEDSEEACSLFFESIKPTSQQTVAIYYPKGREFSTVALMDELAKQNISCALPVINKDSLILDFYLWKDGENLKENKFGIQEPLTKAAKPILPDIVIVPLLAFDRKGHRLGYGGGYYDATLRALKTQKDILSVGLSYAKQAVIFNLPHESHDEALDWIITPQKAHYFGE